MRVGSSNRKWRLRLCRRRSRRRVLLDVDISGLLSLKEMRFRLPRMPCARAVSFARGGVALLSSFALRTKDYDWRPRVRVRRWRRRVLLDLDV